MHRATVTAGFEKEVDEVYQYATVRRTVAVLQNIEDGHSIADQMDVLRARRARDMDEDSSPRHRGFFAAILQHSRSTS